jgi:hypothetical protein
MVQVALIPQDKLYVFSPLRVFLTAEEDRTLFEMRTATTVPQRTNAATS